MERIPNPVTGSLDDGSMPVLPPTRLTVLCRYGFALWLPLFVLISMALADAGLHGWIVSVTLMVPMLLLAAGAHGSWWRPAPWDTWQAGTLVEIVVLLVGTIVAVMVGPLAMTVTVTLLIGGVLGVGASQLWRSRHAAPTSRMLACRYAYALLMPALLLVWSLLPADGPARIILVVGWLVLSLPLSAGANGGWGSTRWGAWHIGLGIESVVVIVAMAWSALSGDRLVIPFAMTLLIGAVLGFGTAHGWRSLRRR